MDTKKRSISGYCNFSSVLHDIISHEQYQELRAYAVAQNIALADFKDFTGDINDIKDMIDKVCIVAKDFPKIITGRKHLVLGLHYENSEDFAGTEANKITLNGLLYNDTGLLAKAYAEKEEQGYFVSGTTWKDIIFHELGHIVSNMYKIDALEISKSILRTNLKTEVADYVMKNLSMYSAAQYVSIVSNQMQFDGSEIIAECFCAYYSNNRNDFVLRFMEECFKLAKKEVET